MTAKHKILIIDDEVDIAKLVREILEDEGFDVAAVHTGEDGLKKVKEFHPDLIFLDWQLPDTEGVDVCRIIKNDDETADIPVVMLTSLGGESHKVRGLEAGADDYMTKPFSSGEMLARVKSILRRQERSKKAVEVEIAKLQKYLPKEMLERISSGPRAAEGERRVVTVMIADLSGFTAMSEQMDPEQVTNLINSCFKLLVDVINQYGGTIDKFMGDAIMALFGSPKSHEDDSERAIYAAIGMMAKLQEFNKLQGDKLPKPFNMRIGINTGEVVAGGVGSDTRMDFTVMGDTVNTTARIQTAAEPGQILVGSDTYQFTNNKFDFNTLPPVAVKNKKEPVEIYQVVSVKKQRKLFNEIEPGKLTPFVGRVREVTFIKGFIDRVGPKSPGSSLSVFGEYGIGKSRIVYQLLGYIMTKSFWCMQVWCMPYGAPFIGYNYSTKEFIIKPEDFKPKISALLQQKPGLVIIDDLDNVSEQNMKSIQEIIDLTPQLPLYTICLHKTEWTPPWSDKAYFKQIEVPELTNDESRTLLDSLMKDVPFELKSLIMQKAEGVPLYIEEIIKHLVYQKILQKAEAGYTVAGKIDEIEIPPKINIIVMAKIDKLSEKTKEIIQNAAVIGREFKYKILRTLFKDADVVRTELNSLKKIGVITENTATTERVFRFKQIIAYEVVTSTVLNIVREDIRKKIDQYLEMESRVM